MGEPKVKKKTKKLDIAYRKSLAKGARDRILTREVSENLSARDIPEDLPGWAKEPRKAMKCNAFVRGSQYYIKTSSYPVQLCFGTQTF